MTRDIKISERAATDVVRIARWLHDRSPRGAAAWRDAFWAAVFRIAGDAERFSLADESAHLGLPMRDALFKTRRGRQYRIIFDFTEQAVYILRVRQPGQ